VIGLMSAVYMASVELTRSTAVCGPIGDCNMVHASKYAQVFGIPVGVLGVAGYLAILGCWLVSRRASATMAHAGQLGLFVLAFGGTVFSAYLTILEPFVIGATCGWCLGSALTMAAILTLAPTPSLTAVPARGRGMTESRDHPTRPGRRGGGSR
jgi:uncharacterized membrane protein